MARVKLQITLPEELKRKVVLETEKKEVSISLWIEFLIKKQFENSIKGKPVIDLGI